MFSLSVDRFVPDLEHKTILFPRAVLEGYYYPMAYINGGGLDLEWAKDEFFREWAELPNAFQLIDEEVEKIVSSPSSLVFSLIFGVETVWRALFPGSICRF